MRNVKPSLVYTGIVVTGLMAASLDAQPTAPKVVTPPTFTSTALQQVDSIAEAEFKKDSLGSITLGVVSGRDLVWSKSYGYVDRARRQRATPSAVYQIASVTKQVTAIMLLQLAESRVVRLSDPVARYFPEIAEVKGGVGPHAPTLMQLATMTSGLPRGFNNERLSSSRALDRWEQSLISALPYTEYRAEPGTTYGYSSAGYAILGAALSRAAGESYVDYVRRRILRPLGMATTDFTLSPDMRDRLATGVDYDVLVKDTLNYEDAARSHVQGPGAYVAAGGLYSTVGDVAKLVSFELGFGPDSILRPETLERRNAVPIVSPELYWGYALGAQVQRWGEVTGVGHSGNTSGYTSQVFYDPTRKYGVIVLRSVGGGHADAHRLAALAYLKLRASLGSAPSPR
jgi:CubicO group peptidase (beta-lactamase class C family)